MQKSNSEQFIKYLNLIEEFLKQEVGGNKHLSFVELIQKASEKNGIIKQFSEDLNLYRRLRNSIVHQYTGESIAEPHEKTIKELRSIYNILIKPHIVYDLFKVEVYHCDVNDEIVNVIKIMRDKLYTHVPVYNGNDFVGILSESIITHWIGNYAQKGGGFLTEEKVIGEIVKYFDYSQDSFEFIHRDLDVLTVFYKFQNYISDKKRLGAMFITQTGKPEEKIIGIITAWDLPRIKKHLNQIK